MPSTYEPIATTTLGSTQTSVTFNSFSGYTDLVLVASVSSSGGGGVASLRFNGDSGSNYSDTYMYGNGTTAASGRDVSQTVMSAGDYPSSGTFSVNIYNFQNYSNSTTNKTVLMRHSTNGVTVASVGLWRNTAAITSIVLSSGGYAAGSTFTLYGIKAA
jgi:hypothetical protein